MLDSKSTQFKISFFPHGVVKNALAFLPFQFVSEVPNIKNWFLIKKSFMSVLFIKKIPKKRGRTREREKRVSREDAVGELRDFARQSESSSACVMKPILLKGHERSVCLFDIERLRRQCMVSFYRIFTFSLCVLCVGA